MGGAPHKFLFTEEVFFFVEGDDLLDDREVILLLLQVLVDMSILLKLAFQARQHVH